jgi:hypothetical protein
MSQGSESRGELFPANILRTGAFHELFRHNNSAATVFTYRKNDTMANPTQKKRKAASLTREEDDQGNHPDRVASAKVKHEVSEDTVDVVSPDASTYSPIHQLIVVDLWSNDNKVVKEALCCFIKNAATVYRAGGAFSIVGAMRRWYKNRDIQELGCAALGIAANRSKGFRLHAKEAGAFDVIVGAMKMYSNNCTLQTYGCESIGKLCLGIVEHAALVVNTMEGHDFILAAMKKFPDDVLLQRWACFALCTLSNWKELQAPICYAGGRRALLDAIETHTDESEIYVNRIQKRARLALQRLLE